jgi:hypothetical protein
LAKGQEPLSSAGLVDFGSILGVAKKWLLYQMQHADRENDAEDEKSADILNQVKQLFSVAASLRQYSTVTYREGDAWVSHAELWIADIEPKERGGKPDEDASRREP